jgi:menaquinone-dependent protoporphyrinogen IX oxidase
MNKRILVAYSSQAGSTAEVAEAVGKALRQNGTSVEVHPIRATGDVSVYDAVVVGGPMIMGWHRDAVQFVAAHQRALSQKPVAYFLTALSLTAAPGDSLYGIPIYQDPALAKPPKRPGKLSWKENYSTISNYLSPALNKAPAVKPVSVGFFAGKLDLEKLDLFSRLFVQVIIGATPGDYRNFSGIQAWATHLAQALS